MTGGSVVKEGKTAEEALNKALKHLGVSKDNVLVEILSSGTRGILGIGAKPARVKATLREEVLAERNLKHLLNDLSLSGSLPDIVDLAASQTEGAGALEQVNHETADNSGQPKAGTVEVREGKVIVTDPDNDDRKAVVRPGGNVRLILNGQLTAEEAQVSGQDILEIELIHDEPVSSFDLRLSKNKMEAEVKYVSRPGALLKLKEQVPAHKVTLLAEVETIVEPQPRSLDELRVFLQELEVLKGIDEEVLPAVLENPNRVNGFLVARGQPAVDGIDAAVRFPFREEQSEEEDDDSYFSRNRLISVKAGDVLAVKVPKTEGQDGWTVTGETVPARAALECELTAKAGCELSEDGGSVVSTIAGRPVIDQTGQNVSISVEPVYVVKEVTQATGDINFAGDVEVQGDVGEGCIIQADGNIQVAGSVSRAVIRAGASVIIHKSVIGSSVSAGGRTALYASVLPAFKQTGELLAKISADAKALKARSASSGRPLSDGTLVQYVIDSKFPALPKTIEGLANSVKASSIPAHEEITDFTSYLRRSLCGLGATKIEKVQLLDDLNNALGHVINMMENCIRRADCIKLRYVQNCSIVSSGDVIIEGQGCYISDIKAGGSVIICGQPGIARGVKISAENDVTVNDLGSEFESRTSVKAGPRGKISAQLVHPDVVLQVGWEKYRVDKPSRSFIAYLDTTGGGRLTVERLTAD